jgi:DNA-binding NarL/FixJ family response regulator
VEFRKTYPNLPVVVVSASDRSSDVIRSIDLGAMGFVPKRSSNQILSDALFMVLSGGIYVPPLGLDATASESHEAAHHPTENRMLASYLASGQGASSFALHEPDFSSGNSGFMGLEVPEPLMIEFSSMGLTPRQVEVLGLLLQGKSNKIIAKELSLSVETIKDHVAAVLRTLNVSSRTQAILAVSQMAQNQASWVGWRNKLMAGTEA